MKLFKDRSGKEEIKSIDFGEVEVGTTKTITIYLKNDSSNSIIKDIVVKIDPKRNDLRIIQAPSELKNNEAKPIVIEWKPSLKLRSPLNAKLIINAKEVFVA